MFIRTYVHATTEVEAKNNLVKLLALGNQLNVNFTIEKCQPFLDFVDSFEVELESETVSEKQLMEFLEGIAPKWSSLPSCMIATQQENHLFIHEIEMIEVYPEFN